MTPRTFYQVASLIVALVLGVVMLLTVQHHYTLQRDAINIRLESKLVFDERMKAYDIQAERLNQNAIDHGWIDP